MDAYSADPRKKIVEAKQRGTPTFEVARAFGVGVSSVKRYAAAAREGGSLAPKRRPGSKPKLGEAARKLLEADLAKRPAATLSQRREFLRRVAGVSVGDSTIGGVPGRLGWTRKKRSVGAAERDEFPRRAWGKNVTLISSMTLDGMGPSLVVEGATTGAVFEAYVEEALLPGLRAGRVVVMDNLSAHKGERIRRLIEGKGCEPVYPPPYSPDFNPIEQAFSKVKGMLCARPRPAPARR